MVAMDDGERPDAAADPRVRVARVPGLCAAPVNVEQRSDDLEVVFHPVMDFADEPPLSFQRTSHLPLRLVDAGDGSTECVTKLLNLRGWAQFAWKVQGPLARLIAA